MKVFKPIIGVLIGLIALFIAADKIFYSSFVNRAKKVREQTGVNDNRIITEEDLKKYPDPIARYMRYSGLVGKVRINSLHLIHSGTFKPSTTSKFMPIKGEYFLTTRKPSFTWYGKITMGQGLSAAAIDHYFNGDGSMQVKVMSAIPVVNARSQNVTLSAFGRCIAEMTMAPSFFLDSERIRWTYADSTMAECRFTDAGLTTTARLHINSDGSLDKIVVNRYYDRGHGKSTLEKFTGKALGSKDHNGLRLPEIFDGYWNLPEGDLHYVHFIVDEVTYE